MTFAVINSDEFSFSINSFPYQHLLKERRVSVVVVNY